MARVAQVVQVDDTSYEITPLPTDEGLALYEELVNVAQKAFAGDAPASGGAEELVAALIFKSLSALPTGTMQRLSRVFAKTCRIGASAGGAQLWVEMSGEMYDDHFAGRYLHWTSWVLACLKVNFADFLSRWIAGAKQKQGAQRIATKAPSP
jgi:hypothetical protein